MREMIFRERQERVSHLDAVAKMVARVFGVDMPKAFGGIVADYAREVFQETYDAELLRERVMHLRQAQAKIRQRRLADERALSRLDRLGEYYDREFGTDIVPKAAKTKAKLKPIFPRKDAG